MSEHEGNGKAGPMTFDLAPIEVPVVIGGTNYILREASEGGSSAWRNATIAAAKMVDGKVVGLQGLAESQAVLIHHCLYEATDRGKQVPTHTIRSWPSRITTWLFEKAKEISDLNEKAPAESPEKKALLAALSREDSPVTLEDIRAFARKLADQDEKAFGALIGLVGQTLPPESQAKNSPASTPTTSASVRG